MYVHSTIRPLLIGIVSSNLHLKQLHMVQSYYLEENVVKTSSITKLISDTLESQLMRWTMYGETIKYDQ